MKYTILFLLLPFLGKAQFIVDTLPEYTDYYSFKSYFDHPTIVFASNIEEVKFTPGRIVYVDSLSNSNVIECDSSIYRILKTVNEKIFKEQSERLNEMYLKIAFYERHFGKLEGDMNSDCIQFIPNKSPERVQPCKE